MASRRQTPAVPVKLVKKPLSERTACSTRKWKSMASACRRVNRALVIGPGLPAGQRVPARADLRSESGGDGGGGPSEGGEHPFGAGERGARRRRAPGCDSGRPVGCVPSDRL